MPQWSRDCGVRWLEMRANEAPHRRRCTLETGSLRSQPRAPLQPCSLATACADPLPARVKAQLASYLCSTLCAFHLPPPSCERPARLAVESGSLARPVAPQACVTRHRPRHQKRPRHTTRDVCGGALYPWNAAITRLSSAFAKEINFSDGNRYGNSSVQHSLRLNVKRRSIVYQ